LLSSNEFIAGRLRSGRRWAAQPNFNYSAAMKAKGGTWTVDELNKFLTKPSAYIPGTLMTFAGLARENQRADVIAFLNTLSDHPKPLPTAQGGQAAPPAAEGAPAKPAPAEPSTK
jgi:cytochrome c